MAKTSYVPSPAKIKVIGLGGAGCNAITRMVRQQIQGVEFIAMNTDAQHLGITEAPRRVHLGQKITRGLGAGGDHMVGQKSAEESQDELKELVADADMVFLTAGMGGGTGTGALPVLAEIAKQSGALTIAVVTKPFAFEGTRRSEVAEEGIANAINKVDTLVIIPNDRLLDLCDRKTGVDGAFKLADEALHHGVQATAEVITVPGLINLDFADVRTVMADMGDAVLGTGTATGEERAVIAAQQAINSPLLEDTDISGALGVLINITGGESLSLYDVEEASSIIYQEAGEDANIIFGAVIDPQMDDELRVTVIATGFNKDAGKMRLKEEKDYAYYRANPEELEKPAVQRLNGGSRPAVENVPAPEEVTIPADDIEVPAFLRKQTNIASL